MTYNARLCAYKGPATGWKNKLGRFVVCFFTASRYSHVELEIGGICFTSSYMDGGVVARPIPTLDTSGHWDFYPVTIDVPRALAQYEADKGKPYDWIGMLRTCPLLRWLPRRDGSRFCSEQVAAMLGVADPERCTPEDLVDYAFDLAEVQA